MGDLPYPVDPRSAAEPGSETEIQIRLLKGLKKLAPKVRTAAVPNGGQRTAWAAMQAKREGMVTGFPDLIIMAPGGLVAFLEMKARDGSPSEAQLDWLGRLHGMGFPCGVFRGSLSAMRFLHAHGFPFLCELEALAA